MLLLLASRTTQHLLQAVANNPILFRLQWKTDLGTKNGVTVYWYGLFVGIAYTLAGASCLWYLAQQQHHNLEREEIVSFYARLLCMYSLPGAIGGARLFSWCLEDNFVIGKLFRPGFWWHGGLLGWLVATGMGAWEEQRDSTLQVLLPLLDSLGLAIPVFEVFNRLGCLSYGCCFGRPVHQPDCGNSKSTLITIRYQSPQSCIHRQGYHHLRHAELLPVPFYASFLATWQAMMTLVVLGTVPLARGALFALGLTVGALIRLYCERYRADFRGSGTSSCVAFCLYQITFALVLFGAMQGLLVTDNDPTAQPLRVTSMSSQLQLFCHCLFRSQLGAAFAMAFVAYGVHPC